jgi:predicted HTH domain antitoxin
MREIMNSVTEINIEIDKSILYTLKESKKEFKKELLFNNALVLYRKNKLSLGKAAELAGYSRLDFITKLQDEGEPIFDYDEEILDKMMQNTDIVSKMIRENK